MATVVYPYTLTAGQPENVNQLNSNLSAITAQVNGNLDATNLASGAVTTAKFATLPGVRAKRTADVSVSTGAWANLAFDGEDYDEGAGSAQHDNSTNAERLICQVAGRYVMTANVAWEGNATGVRGARIAHVGGVRIAAVEAPAAAAANFTQLSVSAQYRMAVGDYVLVEVFQSSGAGLNVKANGGAGNAATWFGMSWVSP